MAPMTSSMALPDFGLRSDDIKYFHMDSRIQGRGPNRLKYLDIEGRWVLSGNSIPFISSAFRHLENLNSAQVPFRDMHDEPLNAIGMVSWTPSSEPTQVEKTTKPPKFVVRPPVVIEDDVPPSPREIMPHRSAGYDSITRYGTRWGDMGYSSSSPSPTDRPYKDELIVKTREEKIQNIPYRTTGYGQYHVKRQYDISPRSMGTDSSVTSGSEQSSPSGGNDRHADEIMLMAYHSKGNLPRLNRTTFMQH